MEDERERRTSNSKSRGLKAALPHRHTTLNSRHMNRELGQRYSNSLRRNKDFHRCRLRALTTHCEKEAIQFRREIACASAFHGVDSSKFGVVICILLLKYRDRPIAAACINPLSV